MLRILLLAFGCCALLSMSDHAVMAVSPNIVISHIQTGGGGTGTSNQEFISIYNNANVEVDITDWCLTYSDYTDATIIDLYCFETAEGMDEVRVQPQGSLVIVSSTYPVNMSNVSGLFKNASTSLSGTRGHVAVYDHANHVVDRVAWDNKASLPPKSPEATAAPAPSGGSMLVRKLENNVFIDTDHNFNDFSIVSSLLPASHPLIDYKDPVAVVDICGNLPDIQELMPAGYDYDDIANCELLSDDICQNVSNIQLVIPQNMSGLEGKCYDSTLDACTNIENFQLEIPVGFREVGTKICKIINAKGNVILSELLPNSTGTDTGNEFIELHNRSVVAIDLSDYLLAIGKIAEKLFTLPDYNIAPGEYVILSDADLGYTLLNSTTQVKLLFYNGDVVDEIIPYQDPGDNISWSLIDEVWQFTDIVTPAQPNVPMTEVLGDNDVLSDNGLAPCPAGKYRNTLTNRCRNIEDDVSVLASCEADEYRNPETNRCKKIALTTSSLTPCADGYERNEETNRCRKTQDDTQLSSCAEGSERNPETNRCRKILTTTQSPDPVDAESPTQQESILGSPYALAATVGTGAMGYGIYEWRTELGAALRRILSFLSKK